MAEARAARRGALAVVLAGVLAGCHGHGHGPDAAPPFPGLTLDLTPDPQHVRIAVEVRLDEAHAAAVTELAVARAWADTRGAEAVFAPSARDDAGEIPLAPRPDDGGPDRVLALGRAPRGALVVRSLAHTGPTRFALHVGWERMSGVGHAFLLLPRFAGSVRARVRFHLEALTQGADAASSFGFGADVTTTASAEELAHAVYVAGKLWLEQPSAAEPGPGALVVVGAPPFDTRTAYLFAAAAFAATGRLFGEEASEPAAPFSFLLVAEPGAGRAYDGAYLTRSLGIWFDWDRGLDAELRLTMAHELTHRFLGGAVRLVEPDGRDAAWFTEGFSVHFARRALLEAGLLAPADLLADVRRTLGEAAPVELPLPADYRRGAQWAAYLDAGLRRESGGARGLEDAMRALVVRAKAEGRTRLPVAALGEALGPKLGADLDRLRAQPDAPVDLPEDAFGPCFRRAGKKAVARWETAPCQARR